MGYHSQRFLTRLPDERALAVERDRKTLEGGEGGEGREKDAEKDGYNVEHCIQHTAFVSGGIEFEVPHLTGERL